MNCSKNKRYPEKQIRVPLFGISVSMNPLYPNNKLIIDRGLRVWYTDTVSRQAPVASIMKQKGYSYVH